MKLISTAIITVLSIAILFSCKNSSKQKKALTASDFIKLYSPLNLPTSVSDSTLTTFGDTSTIDTETFNQFIPDSALQNVLHSSDSQYVIHPAGNIHLKTIDYVLTKFTSPKATKLAAFVMNEKHQYKSSLLLLTTKDSGGYHFSVSVTNEPTFILKRDKSDANNQLLYSRFGYAYNESTNSFGLIMNESNEDKAKLNQVINPIDTLPAANKFSGDYITDKKNFISIRDGKNARNYLFFIHFEKDSGACTGELKGEMNFTDETNSVYQESGDPCVIDFKFSSSLVKVKEEGNCGNYRGITCPFDFSFKKKKPAKPKQ